VDAAGWQLLLQLPDSLLPAAADAAPCFHSPLQQQHQQRHLLLQVAAASLLSLLLPQLPLLLALMVMAAPPWAWLQTSQQPLPQMHCCLRHQHQAAQTPLLLLLLEAHLQLLLHLAAQPLQQTLVCLQHLLLLLLLGLHHQCQHWLPRTCWCLKLKECQRSCSTAPKPDSP
jgi:hypothetical protein